MRFGIVQNDEMLRQRALNRADAYARGGWEASRVGSWLCLPPVGAACGSFLAICNAMARELWRNGQFLKLVSATEPKPPCPPRTAESSMTFTQHANRI